MIIDHPVVRIGEYPSVDENSLVEARHVLLEDYKPWELQDDAKHFVKLWYRSQEEGGGEILEMKRSVLPIFHEVNSANNIVSPLASVDESRIFSTNNGIGVIFEESKVYIGSSQAIAAIAADLNYPNTGVSVPFSITGLIAYSEGTSYIPSATPEKIKGLIEQVLSVNSTKH